MGAGVVNSPEMLENGRFRFASSLPTWLWRGRSGTKRWSRSSWLNCPSFSSLFSILWIRSANSLMYLGCSQ